MTGKIIHYLRHYWSVSTSLTCCITFPFSVSICTPHMFLSFEWSHLLIFSALWSPFASLIWRRRTTLSCVRAVQLTPTFSTHQHWQQNPSFTGFHPGGTLLSHYSIKRQGHKKLHALVSVAVTQYSATTTVSERKLASLLIWFHLTTVA